jgi:hypothetical protein
MSPSSSIVHSSKPLTRTAYVGFCACRKAVAEFKWVWFGAIHGRVLNG